MRDARQRDASGALPDGSPLTPPAREAHEITRLREALICKLTRQSTLTDARIADALRAVPRHSFVPEASLQRSYEDSVVPVKHVGDELVSTLSQPSAIVVMLEQLQVQDGMRVLEIGTGTGYNAALLAALAGPKGKVTTVDIDEDLSRHAEIVLDRLGYSTVHVQTGDGFLGVPEHAPYDRIELSVATPAISPAWTSQLVDGGLFVGPIRVKGMQFLTPAFRKNGAQLVSESIHACHFVPMRGSRTANISTYRLPVRPNLRFVWESPDEFPAGLLTRILRQERKVLDEVPVSWPAAAYILLTNEAAFYTESTDGRVHGIAILDRDSESLASVISSSDGWGAAAIVMYGGEGARRRLAHSIDAWARNGRPGIDALRLTAVPSPGPEKLGPRAQLIRQPYYDLIASYEISH